MIRVNLLAPAGAPAGRRISVPPRHRGAALGILMMLVTGAGVFGWVWQNNRQGTALDARISDEQAKLARLRAEATLVERAAARTSELTEKLALIERLRTAQKSAVTLLATLSRSLPDGLWLLELERQGDIVRISGRANSLTAVTDFVERLQDSGIFDRPVDIVSTGTEQLDEISVVRFAVKSQAAGTRAREATAAAAAARKGK